MECNNGEKEENLIFCKTCGVRVNDEHIPCNCANSEEATALIDNTIRHSVNLGTRTYLERVEHEAELEVCLEQTLNTVRRRTKANRPNGTKLQYAPKAEEYINWCRRKSFPLSSFSTVTNKKLLLFLMEEVVGRKSRTQPSIYIISLAML